ncbi:hypothetical protein VNO80_18311 [Phaseolus coccineus]|uniref:Uncharacterized protein n=1 Tax=Phaseolus coccineus TaxID=3886 RepID=A0AAN9QWD2_PHACN
MDVCRILRILQLNYPYMQSNTRTRFLLDSSTTHRNTWRGDSTATPILPTTLDLWLTRDGLLVFLELLELEHKIFWYPLLIPLNLDENILLLKEKEDMVTSKKIVRLVHSRTHGEMRSK